MQITHYKNFELSDFQIDSIQGILDNENLILSTHTGNGKTMVADFAVNECFNNGLRVIYTAPIKALSNQKFNQFKLEYGKDNVGLITGDRVINDNAPILVVTTEVLRNMLHESREKVDDIKFIVLDEVHYIGNQERGKVWEEIFYFKNHNSRIIGLSATIPNLDEFCEWIDSIHDEGVKKVYYPDRIIPQKYYYFDKKIGKATIDKVFKNYNKYLETTGYVPYSNTHVDFMRYAKKSNIFPALYFVFSRKQCEDKAYEIAKEMDLLSDEEKEYLDQAIENYELKYPEIMDSKTWDTLKTILSKGIAYHHAGLLPIIKQFIEQLFEKKICKILYATETFAVGINYPVKTVCFDSMRKYDGKNFRILLGSEFLQMAGRAGRRGLDKFGLVFVLTDYKAIEEDDFLDINEVCPEPIKSQFDLSYNTTLNMTRQYSYEEIIEFFSKSLANFQFIRNVNQSEKQLEILKNNVTEAVPDIKCKMKDINRCPLIQEKNKEKLKMFQSMLNNNALGESEQLIINNRIDDLKNLLKSSPFKCPKSSRKKCIELSMDYNRKEKELQKSQKRLDKRKEKRPELKFEKDFSKRTNILKQLGYIDDDRKLLARGQVCSKLHVQELFVTELLFSGFFHDNDEDTINAIMAGLVCEDEKVEQSPYAFKYDFNSIYKVIEAIEKVELKEGITPETKFYSNVCGVMHEWSRGGNLFDIVEQTNYSEGDFVSLCRRTIDLLRQVKNTLPDDIILKQKILDCINKIDRDLVKLGL